MQELEEGDLLTVAQACKLLPVSDSLMRKLAETGEIASIRVKSTGSRRGRILIERASLDEYVARLRGKTTPRQPARVDVDAVLHDLRRERGTA